MRSRLTLVLSILTASLLAVTLAACGGGSKGSPLTEMAGMIPTDAAVYAQGSIKPDSEVQSKADGIAKKLTGSTLGDLVKEGLASSDNDVDFETDVKPWLGDNAAMYAGAGAFGSGSGVEGVTAEGEGDSDYGVVIQTSDADAASSFVEKQSEPGSTGEYEGNTYGTLKGDDSVGGVVDDNFVSAANLDSFKAIVDASKGDSLKDDDGFNEVADKVSDGSLVNVYLSSAPATEMAKQQGADYSGLYSALGVDPAKSGAMFSLVPEENEISIQGIAADQPDLKGGDASELIASFPANTVFAMGSGNIGENVTKVINSLDKEGVEGMLKPGQLGKSLDQLSEQGLDVRSMLENLEDFGLFVQGGSPRRLGGALVLTSSDLDSFRSSLKGITAMIRLAGDAAVRPLGGGLTGIRFTTPELPGRPLVLAVGEDRAVLAVGMPAAMQALKGEGADLGSTEQFKAAQDSIGGALGMYADPVVLAKFLSASSGANIEAAQFAGILAKFNFAAAGTGSEDGSVEINLGLK
ncbi:MAG: DUF3352 domain-containing protein [Solirubrobacterales bacterium]|nr:DUF3352 domain-containing protein [Solirubrobacterales bacterium]